VESERWRKIETIFHSARQREPSERSAFLVIMRPFGRNTAFIQLDDLAPDNLQRVRDAACIIMRKAVGKFDKAASGATRVAGTETSNSNTPRTIPW
jgi:hypothetical protein